MRCGWCESPEQSGSNCANCGGPLAVRSGSEAGLAPPRAPRDLPAKYLRRVLFLGNFGVIFGSIFGGIGGVLTLVFLVISCAFPPMLLGVLIAGIFPVIGGAIGGASYLKARRRVRALREGAAVVGVVDAVTHDLSVQVNGQHPWRVSYTFEAGGRLFAGGVSTFDAEVKRYTSGDPIHVVYLAADPDINATWPPLG